MPWSTEDTRPAGPVLGDPASVAALAAVLRRVAADLDRALEALPAHSSRGRRHTARLRGLHADGAGVVASLDRAGGHLGDHATELADALGLAHRLVDRAHSLGLSVDGPVVTLPRGVQGVADSVTEQRRSADHARLQQVLDTVLADLDARRRVLREDLDTERTRRTSR